MRQLEAAKLRSGTTAAIDITKLHHHCLGKLSNELHSAIDAIAVVEFPSGLDDVIKQIEELEKGSPEAFRYDLVVEGKGKGKSSQTLKENFAEGKIIDLAGIQQRICELKEAHYDAEGGFANMLYLCARDLDGELYTAGLMELDEE